MKTRIRVLIVFESAGSGKPDSFRDIQDFNVPYLMDNIQSAPTDIKIILKFKILDHAILNVPYYK